MALPEESALREVMIGFKRYVLPVSRSMAKTLRLLQSGQHSDLTICSIDREYAVHKAIVCPQSTFFWSACTNDFQVRKMPMQAFKCSLHQQGRESRTIHLHDDDPNAVHRMIQYLYALTYPDESPAVGVVSQDTPNGMCIGDASGLGPVAGWHAGRDNIAIVEQTVIEREGKPKVTNDSSEGHIERGINLSETSPDLILCALHQDLRVYALADKYGIQNLKKKAINILVRRLGTWI